MRQRNLRKRREASPDEEEVVVVVGGNQDGEDLKTRLELTRTLQKSRQRIQGVNAETAKPSTGNQTKPSLDTEVMGGYIKEQTKASKGETDEEREKYIREQLDKRLGRNKAAQDEDSKAGKADDMYAIPAALRTQKANQEDVSAWMTGIVEVPLSVNQKLRNVEETEEAKRRLLSDVGEGLTGEDGASERAQQMSRLTLPLRFGQHTAQDEAWQAAALKKQQQPRDWKKKRRAPS